MLDMPTEKRDTAQPNVPALAAPMKSAMPGGLPQHFIDLMLEDVERQLKPLPGPSSDWLGGLDLDAFGLDDPEPAEPAAPEKIVLSVNTAAAALLLAAAFEGDAPLLRALRRDAAIVVVQAPDVRSKLAIEVVLKTCALGKGTSILVERNLDSMHASPVFERRHAVILSCDVDRREREKLEDRSMTALSLSVPVCAIALDVGRQVPLQIRSAADRVIVPGGWTAPLLALLIKAVTGDEIKVPDASWIGTLTLDDMRMSVSQQRGAEGSLARLRQVAARRTSVKEDAPKLEALSGYGKAKAIGLEMIRDLQDLRDGRIGWQDVGRGLVLAGPPGTGKTFYARSFARSAGLPLFVGSLATWQASRDGHLGDTLAAMKRLFADARAAAPSIVFIDELDSFGDRATFHHRHRDYSSQVINGLLEELDGASDRQGVVVLAATNLVERIDPAILRPGRLDRVVYIDLPTATELAGIMRTQLGTLLAEADILPAALAGRGGTGADAALWVRSARGIARRAGRDLTFDDLMAAIRDGRDQLPLETRQRVALHEAAHACAFIALGLGRVEGVSLHDAGGTTHVESDLRATTRQEAMAMIVHLLSGRAAETAFLGSASAGAGGGANSDLGMATRVACGIEGSWGLGRLGPVWMGDAADMTTMLRVSAFIGPVRKLLIACEEEALRFVTAHEEPIRRCAEALLKNGYLDGEAVLAAIGDVMPFGLNPHLFDRPHVDEGTSPA